MDVSCILWQGFRKYSVFRRIESKKGRGKSMEIRQLVTFERVAECLSFSRAAEQLGYSQSTVTIQIKQLEEEYHTQLFDRIGRHVRLTSEGERFLAFANDILNRIYEMRSDMGNENFKKHQLRLGVIDSLMEYHLSDVLLRLYEQHPNYQITIKSAPPSELVQEMTHNELDIIYLLDQPIYDKNWIKALEAKESIVFVTSATSPLARRENVSMEEVIHQPFFSTEAGENYRKALDQYLAARGMALSCFLEIQDPAIIIRMLKEHGGVSFLPYFCVVDQVTAGQLAIVQVEDFHMHMQRQCIYHRDKWVTEEMRAFLKLIH